MSCGGCSTKSGGCCGGSSKKQAQPIQLSTQNETQQQQSYDIVNGSRTIVYDTETTASTSNTSTSSSKGGDCETSSGGGCGSSGCGSNGCGSKSSSSSDNGSGGCNGTKKHVNQNDFIVSDSIEQDLDGNLKTFGACPSTTAQAGKETVCQSCPGKDSCSSQSLANLEERKAIDTRMKVIKYKLMVVSGKGGVGKSSITSLLAYSLANRNKKVSILDIDICGPSIPKLMGVEGIPIVNSEWGWIPPSPSENGHQKDIKVMSVGSMLGSSDSSIIWKGPRKTTIINRLIKDTYWGRQDFLIVDTPPGTSDEHISIANALHQGGQCKINGVIVVTSPQDLAVSIVKREIDFCIKQGLPILGIVENMSGYACPCCDEITEVFKSDGGLKLAQSYNIPFLGKVPIDQNIGYCSEHGKCVICDYPESSGTKSINSITDKILEILEKQSL